MAQTQVSTNGTHHELDSPPWHRIDGTIMSTAHEIRLYYDRVYEAIGLSLPEACVVALVAESGGLTQTQIAHTLDVGRASIGIRIDDLEKRGLVERLPHATDRRVWLIEATDSGKALLDKIKELDRDARTQLRSGISHKQRQELAAILVRIRQNIMPDIAE